MPEGWEARVGHVGILRPYDDVEGKGVERRGCIETLYSRWKSGPKLVVWIEEEVMPIRLYYAASRPENGLVESCRCGGFDCLRSCVLLSSFTSANDDAFLHGTRRSADPPTGWHLATPHPDLAVQCGLAIYTIQ